MYDSADGTFEITGTLTLNALGDPDGVFIFLTDSTLITAASSVVAVENGARFCRVFWRVGSSATLGASSTFVGHILAMTSITANTSATIQGQLLARNGAVTLQSNTIINGFCGLSPTPTPGGPATPTPTVTTLSLPLATPTATPTLTPTITVITLPQTGDTGGNSLWLGLLAVAAGALLLALGIVQYRHRQRRTKP